jgi:CheY-like chemotaxis protein
MKKVMIFDDDVEIFSILNYIVEDNGWQLQCRENCDNLIQEVREMMPDLILMDNWIPQTGGVAATQTLKKEEDLKNIPVIYFSANNDIALLARQAGADTYIAKPFDLDDLESLMKNTIQKSYSSNREA